ncbi:LOW QUALITY PROTEIN: polypeptide N-acetylgalactosaminyltransferase 10 [Hyalella azteca]|uniref:LOW QUALITY PROTEIN: polypeptide N-acetylgalactosaminyltransferase 10 n=2 Tax=Hyalella azteca TaxID=294128 RepID=A0A979FQ01_HYAAZ|nr:LOW QUALITY PROTEIN: polypeptide N-acetylgalactosaminyltransferase 10 [Hyalella azteca]
MRIRWKLPRIRPVSLILILVGATVLWFLVLSRPRRGLGDQLDPLKYEHLKRDYFDVPDSVEYVGPFPDSKVPEGVQLELVDYHDYEQVKRDKARVGLGEQGRPAKVPPGNKALEDKLYLDNGFNGLLSDYIALDRSLPDIRHPACASYKYYKNLPTTSVVIPFFEESLSALQRTIVSVVNRTPAHLLKEIILVDDGSFKNPDLKAPLEAWLRASAPKARLLRLPEREGLITARMAGAKAAIGDVIVVLDSHCEVLVNWLPPLLHPIVEDHRVAVCPLIDVIAWDTFAYHAQDDGARGAFDWNFFYKRIPLAADVAATLPRPFQNPVMNGGLFAISRAFFWELGGYDPELAIWGGEQYNLSFKVAIWPCGGQFPSSFYRSTP